MNGANAEPSVKTIKNPSNNRNRTIGVSHHFFRAFKNCHNSLTMEILLIMHLRIVFEWN